MPGLSADLTAALGESRKAVKSSWRFFVVNRVCGKRTGVGVGVGVDVGVDVGVGVDSVGVL